MVKPLLAGNWKMHGNANSATELVEQLAAHEDTFSGVDMIVFPPAVHLSAVVAVPERSLEQCSKTLAVIMYLLVTQRGEQCLPRATTR